jgi:hypothetical protein
MSLVVEKFQSHGIHSSISTSPSVAGRSKGCVANNKQEYPMSRVGRIHAVLIQSLCVTALLAATIGTAFAQDGSAAAPPNARPKTYGIGWECKVGYRESNGACTQVKVPTHGYGTNTSYGQGWECRRGYRAVDEHCVAIEVPANAYLNSSGDSWECERGFRKVKNSCVAINVPANAYLVESSYGSGWVCNWGYRVSGRTCEAIKVPANAYLNDSGDDWVCDRKYRKVAQTC